GPSTTASPPFEIKRPLVSRQQSFPPPPAFESLRVSGYHRYRYDDSPLHTGASPNGVRCRPPPHLRHPYSSYRLLEPEHRLGGSILAPRDNTIDLVSTANLHLRHGSVPA
ncbi:unnamed protein product, partial [Ectocarpus fasciculatus]